MGKRKHRERPALPAPADLPDDQILPGVTRAPSYNYWEFYAEARHTPMRPMYDAWRHRYDACLTFVSGVVLDLACGWGRGTALLTTFPKVTRAIGCDAWGRAVKCARAETRKRKLPCSFEVADFDDLDWEIPSADWIVCLETLEDLLMPATFVQHMQKAARLGIAISIPPLSSRSTERNAFHQQDIAWERIEGWMQPWGALFEHEVLETRPPKGAPIPISEFGAWLKF